MRGDDGSVGLTELGARTNRPFNRDSEILAAKIGRGNYQREATNGVNTHQGRQRRTRSESGLNIVFVQSEALSDKLFPI